MRAIRVCEILICGTLIPLGLPGFAFGQTGAAMPTDRMQQMDRHARSAPAAASRTVRGLAEYLTKPASTDLERLRAIHSWVTHNIEYDTQAYFSGNLRSAASPEATLRSRKGVCDGYAGLVQLLGEAAGLTIRKVAGYAKGFGFKQGERVEGNANHAWNVVQLDGKWQLLDATWDAGYIDRKTRRFVRRETDLYFLAPPRQFAYDHFPQDAQWQLLSPPLSPDEFEAQVFAHPILFRLGVELESHTRAVVEVADRAEIVLRVPSGVNVMARVMRGDEELDRSLAYVHLAGGKAQVHAIFPMPGEYALSILTRRGDPAGMYESALQYTVRSSQGTAERFPEFFQAFFDLGLGLDSHRDGIIRANTPLEIALKVPADIGVMADLTRAGKRLPGNWVLVQHAGEGRMQVRGVVPVPGDYELRLFAGPRAGAATFNEVLVYRVVADEGASSPDGVPQIFIAFSELGASLLEPLRGVLPAGVSRSYRVRVPGAAKVAVIQGQSWTYLNRTEDLFEGQAVAKPGTLDVAAQLSGETRFQSLLRYSAR